MRAASSEHKNPHNAAASPTQLAMASLTMSYRIHIPARFLDPTIPDDKHIQPVHDHDRDTPKPPYTPPKPQSTVPYVFMSGTLFIALYLLVMFAFAPPLGRKIVLIASAIPAAYLVLFQLVAWAAGAREPEVRAWYLAIACLPLNILLLEWLMDPDVRVYFMRRFMVLDFVALAWAVNRAVWGDHSVV